MQYLILGGTGLRVARIALGALGFGNRDWGADVAESSKILDAYLERGGNFVDSANIYGAGESERVLGRLLAERDRSRVVLATKWGYPMDPGDPNSAGNHRKNLRQSLDGSLARLGTDYIDLLWVHMRDTLTPVSEVMRALDDQVRTGTVLHLGASNWPAWEVAEANTLALERGWTPFSAIQCRYNLVDRTIERELTPMARALNVSVFAWSPLAGGLLAGDYPADGVAGRPDTPPLSLLPVRTRSIMAAAANIAERAGLSPAQLALAWLLARRPMSVPIVGATQVSHVSQAFDVLETSPDLGMLDELTALSAIELGYPHDLALARREISHGSSAHPVVNSGTGLWRDGADGDVNSRAG